MQKIKLDKQSIVFITLAVFLVIEVFIILPWGIGKIVKSNKEIKSLKQQIKAAETEWPRLSDYSKKVETLQSTIKNYKQKAIKQGQESRLISFISENSRKYNIKIKAITPLDSIPAENDNFNYVPFQIEAEGEFHNLGNFFSFLQNSDYFFELKELTLAGFRPTKINMLLCGLKQKEE